MIRTELIDKIANNVDSEHVNENETPLVLI